MELKRFFSNSKIENNGFVVLENEEHNHLKNVLRFKIKDKVIVVCNDNFDYVCEIEEINKNNSVLKVIEKQENKHNPKINVSVFQALVKNDNMNLIVVTIRDSDDWNTHLSLYDYAKDTYTSYKVLDVL